jgi:hypothetical protein
MSASEYDLRQYGRMRDTILAYREGRLSLRGLIADLEALLGALENPSREWEAAARHEWGGLEEVYSYRVQEGQSPVLDDQDRRILGEKLDALQALLGEMDVPL